MEQDTKTPSDNEMRSHKLGRREARPLAPPPGDNILFIPNSPLRPVTNTTRASLASKISRIFTFTRAPKLEKKRGLKCKMNCHNCPSLDNSVPLKFCVPKNVAKCSWVIKWGKTFLRYASVVSIKNIGNGKNECDWVPLYGDKGSMRHHLALRVAAVTREFPSAGNLCLLVWTNIASNRASHNWIRLTQPLAGGGGVAAN